ncbi:uncharacterized protein LOC115995970 [Ipomoea triloba]|uniref:uncharacterized protein LOC115995970 n=1 Tax=Ipomoea triloba TaxID=35885 RepID=UPI00125E3532|nr:uncharacterized protein LOC115995970 [Ipomoea triloba]
MVNAHAATQGPDAPEYVSKARHAWTFEVRTRNNPDNITILFKTLDKTLFQRIRKCQLAKDICNILMQIGEGDEQKKENKLSITMKKFEDFRMVNGKSIAEMETWFMKLMCEIANLGKELT